MDKAEREAGAVVITGRDGVFSAGFDLKELAKGEQQRTDLVNRGAAMLLRLFSLPQPVVVASAGHAIAAALWYCWLADTRLGAAGDFKYGLNETAIGMSLPPFGMEMAKCRLCQSAIRLEAIIQAQL